jgi:hypothetical protein
MPKDLDNAELELSTTDGNKLSIENERDTKAISARIEKDLYIKAKHYAFDRDIKFNKLVELALKSLVLPAT